MNILYIGDVMGEVGLEVVEKILPGLKKDKQIDLAIAQAENVTGGRGINQRDFTRLKKAGVDFCTGGNWTLYQEDIIPALNDPKQPIIRPANYPDGTPGLGYKKVHTATGSVLVVSLMGKIVGRDSEKPIDNPLHTIDQILEKEQEGCVATVVNLHGDFSSEKFIIGYYLDGRASVVVGDHWHVPTADADILPGGTAHMTDVGMCGSLDSSLGVNFDSVIPRWRDGVQTRNVLETKGRKQFNALHVKLCSDGQAEAAEHVRIVSA
jgi:metallophosphoesterase (TIGR00282 family)